MREGIASCCEAFSPTLGGGTEVLWRGWYACVGGGWDMTAATLPLFAVHSFTLSANAALKSASGLIWRESSDSEVVADLVCANSLISQTFLLSGFLISIAFLVLACLTAAAGGGGSCC